MNLPTNRNVEMSRRDTRVRRQDSQVYPSAGLFGWAMVLLGGVIFGSLAYLLKTSAALTQWDLPIAKTFRAAQVNADWPTMENMLFGCFLGKEVAAIIGTVLTVYYLYKKAWRELTMVVAGLGGGILIWYALSRYFDRSHPSDHLDVLRLAGSSFPSGPAVMAILCYGMLAYLLIPKLPTLFWKALLALLSFGAIILVALSSLLFGTHYASDVLAGLALGLAWFGVVGLLADRLFPQAWRAEPDPTQKLASFQGWRAPGLFQRRPLLGLTLTLLAILGFVALGDQVLTNGSLVQLDMAVYRALLAKAKAASPGLNDIMLFGFFLGKQAVQVIALLLSLYFLSQRYWRELAMLQISTQGAGLLKNFVIDYFSRPRPPEQLGLGVATIPSFPSGHALGTMVCYGFLAYLLIPKMPSLFWKWMLGLAMLALVLFEGLSRIFHGNHYLTDVLAGYAMGMAVVVSVCTLIEIIFMRGRRAEEPH